MTSVLRLGHRKDRDKRMTTHVGLTARALGAERMFLPEMDRRVKKTIEDVSERFGGSFKVEGTDSWRRLVSEWLGEVVHLTMYGEDLDEFFENNELENPLIIIGSQKVPREVYESVDFNVSVGNQPHSEVAALAVFLDRMNKREIPKFSGKIGIKPSKKGKRVLDYSKIPDAGECYRFLKEKDVEQDLLEHSFKVLQRTMELHEKYGGDLRLLIAGALLHDVGRTVTHGVEHGIEGGRIISEKGWHEELAKIVERHIGGGITKVEAEEQGLPAKSYVPTTLEEKIICHADNTAHGIERWDDLINRTEEAGFHDSVNRMKELAEYFEDNLYLESNP